MSKWEHQLGFRTLQGRVNVVFFVCLFFSIAYPIRWDSEIDAWTSRLHAGVFKVRWMKLNGASDLVLRATRAKLTLSKSVTFRNYQQKKKKELSPVSLRQSTRFHCSRMPPSLPPSSRILSTLQPPPEHCPEHRSPEQNPASTGAFVFCDTYWSSSLMPYFRILVVFHLGCLTLFRTL